MRKGITRQNREIWLDSLGPRETAIPSLAGSWVPSFNSSMKRYILGSEYVALASEISRLLADKLQSGDDGVYTYDSVAWRIIPRALSMTMASLLPTISILALYFIDNDLWRMGFIIIFSVIFTACLSMFTGATRIEIFLASVGLASVQAVFVGNLIGPTSGPLGGGNNQTVKG
jgi:hypothetical protein